MEAVKKGYIVTLDRSAFYPEGGGQPADHGTLGEIAVTDVHEKDGIITHSCSAPLTVGTTVHGKLDWARRFDHMQQHSGEHILSGLIHQTFGYHNVGFHIGNTVMEVDFDGPITPEQLCELPLICLEKRTSSWRFLSSWLEGYKLRVHSLVGAKVSAKKSAYEISVDRGIITWEMYVFKITEKFFEIGS